MYSFPWQFSTEFHVSSHTVLTHESSCEGLAYLILWDGRSHQLDPTAAQTFPDGFTDKAERILCEIKILYSLQ